MDSRSWGTLTRRTRHRFAMTAILAMATAGFTGCLSTLLPGFRQFRFPAKLFTFTTLGMAALAGLGVG